MKFDDIKKYYAFRALIKRFILPILVVFMIDSGLSLEQIALIAAVSSVVGLILEVPSGAVADTIGHRRTLIISVIGQAISMALYLGGSFYFIFAGGVLYFASGTLLSGTMQALLFERLKDMRREKDFKKVLGRAISFANGAGIVSMLLAGVVYVYKDWLPFVVNIFMFIVAAVVMLRFKEVKTKVSVEEREGFVEFFSHFGVAVKSIVKQKFLFWMIVLQALTLSSLFAMMEFDQVILLDVGVAVTMLGVVYALKRIVVVVLAPTVHLFTDSISPPIVLIGTSLLAIIFLLLVPVVSNAVHLVGILLIATVSHVSLRIVSSDYTNQMIESGSRATTLSMMSLLLNIFKVGILILVGIMVVSTRVQDIYSIIGFSFFIILIPLGFLLVSSYKGSILQKKLQRA